MSEQIPPAPSYSPDYKGKIDAVCLGLRSIEQQVRLLDRLEARLAAAERALRAVAADMNNVVNGKRFDKSDAVRILDIVLPLIQEAPDAD